MSGRRISASLTSWLIGVVFIYAGVLKAMDPAAFAEAILNYRIIGISFAWPLALLLPWLEIVAGLALLLPGWRRSGACVLTGLTLAFVVALVSAIWRGLDINCGCFGEADGSPAHLAIVRNVLILAGLWLILRLTDRPSAK